MLLNIALKAHFLKKLAKVNAKAVKLGMDLITVSFGAVEEVEVGSEAVAAYRGAGNKWFALHVAVTVEGEAPVIGGHRVLGVVDLRGTKPVVRKSPHASDVDMSRFFTTDCTCDHCGTRRQRNDVIVVENVETGAVMQIGRNCAADFFGTSDASQRLAVSDWVGAYESKEFSAGQVESVVPLTLLFTYAATCIRAYGWVSASMAQDRYGLTPTRAHVFGLMFPSVKGPAVETLPEDHEMAAAAVVWFTEKMLSAPATSDFERSVQASVEGAGGELYVRLRNMNYVLWAVNSYQYSLIKAAEISARAAAVKEEGAVSEYVGVPAARRHFVGTVVLHLAMPSDFGVKYMVKLLDADGNVLVWFGTNEFAERVVVGNTYSLKATVKSHDLYKGVKQTVLTRAAYVDGTLKEDE